MFFNHDNILEKMDLFGDEALYFSKDLYEEHLENASFLYGSRVYLLKNPHMPWLDVKPVEDRINAHLAALTLGDDMGVEVCRNRINDNKRGVLYTAVRLFCRLGRADCVKDVLDGLDPGNTQRITEVTQALCHDFPVEWHDLLRDMVLSGDGMNIRMASEVIGYLRLPMMNEMNDFIRILNRDRVGIPAPVIRAAGRLRLAEVRHILRDIIKQNKTKDHDGVKYEAYLTLLRIGEKNLMKSLLQDESAGNRRYLIMGLCGSFANVPALQEISLSSSACNESLLALGFLGDLSSVDLLIKAMHDPQCSGPASLALNLLTGADLYEDVFIPDPIDESLLFTWQKEKLKRGEPIYPPGEEPGETVNRLSQNPEHWKNWWIQNKIRFNKEERYRNGLPYSPAGILKTMESPKSPGVLRQLAYEELVIRYGKDVCFDISFPVKDQITALNTYRTWASTCEKGSTI